VVDVDECANSICSSGYPCLNLMGSYTCLPSVVLDAGSPRVLTNMSGGESVIFQLSFQASDYFSSLGDLIDEKYYLSVAYGTMSSPSNFIANELSLTLQSGSSSSYTGSFRTSAGYGANLAVQLQWTLGSNWSPGDSFARSGYIASTETFRYPSPIIDTKSLRLNSSSAVIISDDNSYGYVNIPPTGSSFWLTFSGSNFGQFPGQVGVSYQSVSLNGTMFPCVTSPDPTVVNGPSGSVSPSSIICRTATAEPPGDYIFIVGVAGQDSVGVDRLIFPVIPTILSVSGCSPCLGSNPGHTCHCPTNGGVTITITGLDFGSNMEAYVETGDCTEPTLLALDQLTCILPPGTGNDISLTVLIRLSSSEVLQSPIVYMISYASPVVSGLVHTDCQASTSVSLVDCPRSGGGTLTITGQNLGVDRAVVLVGSGLCGNLVHVAPSTQLQCILPPGIATYVTVVVIQSGGAMSVEATVSYMQCAAGTYQNGAELNCQPCPPGFITSTEGLYVCSACPSGTISNGNKDSCVDCLAGQWSPTNSTICSDCPLGFYSSTSRSLACLECPAGTFQDQLAASSCTNCIAGNQQSATGTSSCQVCEVGKYSASAAAVACLMCEAGKTQALSGQTACTNCAFGKYKDTTSTADCFDCVAGKFTSSATTLFVCADCDVGKVQPSVGTTACSLCSIGTFQGSVGHTSCVDCANGTYAGVTGLSICLSCAAGKYIDAVAASSCVDCLAGRYVVTVFNPWFGLDVSIIYCVCIV
jgi:hypothetical protein